MCIHYGSYETHVIMQVENYLRIVDEIEEADLLAYALEELSEAWATYEGQTGDHVSRWVYFALIERVMKRLEERYPGTLSQYIEEFLSVARGFTSAQSNPRTQSFRSELRRVTRGEPHFYRTQMMKRLSQALRDGEKLDTTVWDDFTETLFRLAREMFEKNPSQLSEEEWEQLLEKALVQSEEKVS